MPLLLPATLERINRQVYRRFPAIRGAKPTLRREGALIRLIYTHRAATPDGYAITQRVRVLVTAEGKIIKANSSK